MRLMHVVGARPNFMKAAPLMREAAAREGVEQVLVHTGQHYDVQMSATFFKELNLNTPHTNLNIGSGSHALQTSAIMAAFEPVLIDYRPDVVVLVGDVNSTLACALVSAKLGFAIAHVEAGLRSRDRRMPEEINRILTDQLADLLLTPSRDADANLIAENISRDRIFFVGNIMIDSLILNLDREEVQTAPVRYALAEQKYVVVTLHRPANVDEPARLAEIFDALSALTNDYTVVFPIHPRTRQNAESFGITARLRGVRLLEPIGYLDMLGLQRGASLVITDSGGIQEETTALGTPCLTLRDSTERPVTIDMGTNTLVPICSSAQILAAVPSAITKRGRLPEKWDGHTASRILDVLQGRAGAQARALPELIQVGNK